MNSTNNHTLNGLPPTDKKALLARLARIEGQVRGIRELIEQERECELIAQQLSAVRGAIQKAFAQMVACAMKQQLAAGPTSKDEADPTLEKLSDLIAKYG